MKPATIAGGFGHPNTPGTARWRLVVAVAVAMVGLATCVACSSGEPTTTALRARVVQLVQSGELGHAGEAQESVALPSQYTSLSATGEIVIARWDSKLRVVFFSTRGVVDAWEGYVFASDCKLTDDPLGGVLVSVEGLGDCWFFAKAH